VVLVLRGRETPVEMVRREPQEPRRFLVVEVVGRVQLAVMRRKEFLRVPVVLARVRRLPAHQCSMRVVVEVEVTFVLLRAMLAVRVVLVGVVRVLRTALQRQARTVWAVAVVAAD
jgi:hypothetical protein